MDTNSGKDQFPLHDRTQFSSAIRVRVDKRRIRRALEKSWQHWVNVLGRLGRLSQSVSGNAYLSRDGVYLALVNQLYNNQFLEGFQLNGCGSRAWTTCTYLKELARISPAFERSVHHTPCIMIHQIVVVIQVRNRSIYCCDWVYENGKSRGEMSGRYACLPKSRVGSGYVTDERRRLPLRKWDGSSSGVRATVSTWSVDQTGVE